ncbi:MAG TPA: RHS repeat-associated core domain-containing protein [Chitinophagaceae bacterium]|nr:RHS repeat-associated core domain-containing protein [Chitinophagaceae bacterium]
MALAAMVTISVHWGCPLVKYDIVPLQPPVPQGTTPLFDSLTFGSRVYELPNHLQNVMVTVSDKKIGVDENGDGIVDYYVADVVTANDYYPFGQLQPGRQYGILGRYGFNGKENDNEVKGEGNQQDYGFRIYSPALGRFLSVDPLQKKFPWLSTYQFSENNPIRFIDLDGAEIFDPFTKWFATDAAITIITKPNSTKAKGYGAIIGVVGSVQGAAEGVVNLVARPVQSAKGLLRVATNTPTENAVEYATNIADKYGDLPEPVQDYAVYGHIAGDLLITASAFKGPIKSTGLKLKAELPPGTQTAGFSFSRAGANLTKKASEFELTHPVETITSSVDYEVISKLSDKELIESVIRPKDYKKVTINTETGKLYDGNTRIYELQRRKLDIDVPYQEYTPDNSMFIEPKEPPKKK